MPQQSNSDPSVRGFQLKMRHSIRNRARTFPISLEPLKEGPRVDSKERILLEAAERGDKHTIVRCLQPPNPVNINCTDIMGRSAIQVGWMIALLPTCPQEFLTISRSLKETFSSGVDELNPQAITAAIDLLVEPLAEVSISP